MTTSDSDQENKSDKKKAAEDRLEEIKKEEKEDASSYYAQGDKGSAMNVEKEFSKPVEPVDKGKEDLNLLKAVAFLGFGLAALAIVFILFFIRDLEERVGGMGSAVQKVEEAIEPLKSDVEVSMKTVQAIQDNLKTVTETVSNLQGKFGSYEKSMAIMELKRALAMIQGISAGSDAGVQSKSSEVMASIHSLLSELGSGDAVSTQPAGEIQMQEAAEEMIAEPVTEEPVVEDVMEEEPADSEIVMEDSTESEETMEEEPAEEESAEEESLDEAPMETEEHGEESAASDVEELPTVEELLAE